MIKGLCQRLLAVASAFLNIEKGSILIYTGAFMAVGVGGAALSVDIGRIVLLRTQMQNRADAGALGGAAQLDALPGAVARATKVSDDSMIAWTTSIADEAKLVTWKVNVYDAQDDHISRGVITTDDNAARFVEVIMQRRTLSFFYAPAVNVLKNAGASNYTELGARAVAMSDPFVCKAQPMMICDPFDDGDPSTTDDTITNDIHIGKGITLKAPPAGGSWTTGNFGFLSLPEDDSFNGAGNSAVAIEKALSDEEPNVCFGLNRLTTAPGSMVIKTINAINTRFGRPWYDSSIVPAPNVINFPKDWIQITYPKQVLGDGVWPKNWYWKNYHFYTNPDGTPVMTEKLDKNGNVVLDANGNPVLIKKYYNFPDWWNSSVTRFQLYLFEQGITFWFKANPKKTIRTELTDMNGWTKVESATYESAFIPFDVTKPNNNDVDGEPAPGQTVSALGPDRRVIRVAVMKCLEYAVTGKDTYPAAGEFLGIFLTRQADDVFDGGGIYGEVLGRVEPRLSLEFHGNVRLVE